MELQYIKGVGPKRVELLNKLGIFTVNDLVTYFPRDYEDRTVFKRFIEMQDGETVCFNAIVMSKISERKIRKGLTICSLIVRDDTGNAVITWFNQIYLKNVFILGKLYSFYGQVSKKFGKTEIQNPVFENVGEGNQIGKIIPIYSSTERLYQNVIRSIIKNVLTIMNGKFEEILPQYLLEKYDLADINWSINNIHFPTQKDDFEKARKRLVFEELLLFQLGLLNIKNKISCNNKGLNHSSKVNINDFLNILPYKLTNSQIKVFTEISEDMESNEIMNRLVQGDVGSGKTIVAALAIFKAVNSGYQVAMMAPTSILAIQHFESLQPLFEKFGIKCDILIGAATKKNKEKIYNKLESGEIKVIFGTHALIQEEVKFNNLGLVIADEQHRFGVRQRNILSQKGTNPDVLIMTATPIPRTLALILYGDLNISVIDELPPGRKPIKTYAVTNEMEQRINNFIMKEIDSGRQCYIVCPLVENSDKIDAKSVEELAEHYISDVFKDYKIAYLYGKMKNKEKDEIMQKFKNKEYQILISTTVIEVGVNVPNSTIMIIENAERFGLAQLHQLRGRVGRGEYQSYCILKYKGQSHITKQRMKIMEESTDGFVISEKDLELRGPGDFFGTRQHGLPDLKIANLFHDIDVLKQVQYEATKILIDDPMLLKKEHEKLSEKINEKFEQKIEL